MKKYVSIIQVVDAEYYTCKVDERITKCGYNVQFEDGCVYESYNHRAFEKLFCRDNMSFGMAIEAAKKGCRIARHGWNGKGQYIQLATGISYKAASGEIMNCEHEAIGNKALAFVGTSGVQIGWLASQADMLADDWYIVDMEA